MKFQPLFTNNFTIRKACVCFDNATSCYDWCTEIGLIKPVIRCPLGNHTISINKIGNNFFYRCQKKTHAPFKKTALSNTWFERHKIPMNEVMFITYFFCERMTYDRIRYHLTRDDNSTVSNETISDIFSYCREVIKICLEKEWAEFGLLGKDGTKVQIDETKIGKRKYHRGRFVDGSWVFGAVDEDGSLRLEVIEDNLRDGPSMIAYINKHISKKTKVVSDCAKFYSRIKEDGYADHLTVNHSVEYVTPEGVHTNRIESHWRALKAYIKTGNMKATLEEHLYEYIFDLYCRRNNVDKFGLLLSYIKDVYCGI